MGQIGCYRWYLGGPRGNQRLDQSNAVEGEIKLKEIVESGRGGMGDGGQSERREDNDKDELGNMY